MHNGNTGSAFDWYVSRSMINQIIIEDGITSTLFHSGTALENGALVTSGGRVMVVSALGGEIRSASEKAYRDVKKISFEGMYYRRDLGEDLLKYRD